MPPPAPIEEQLLAARHALAIAEAELSEVNDSVTDIKLDVEKLHAEIKATKQQTRKHLQIFDSAQFEYEERHAQLLESQRRHDDLKSRYDEEIPALTASNTMLKLQKQRFDDAMFVMEKPLVEELNRMLSTRQQKAINNVKS